MNNSNNNNDNNDNNNSNNSKTDQINVKRKSVSEIVYGTWYLVYSYNEFINISL